MSIFYTNRDWDSNPNVYGLKLSDFSDEQISKLTIEGLKAFASDPRAQKLIIQKINTTHKLEDIDYEFVSLATNYPNIKKAFNDRMSVDKVFFNQVVKISRGDLKSILNKNNQHAIIKEKLNAGNINISYIFYEDHDDFMGDELVMEYKDQVESLISKSTDNYTTEKYYLKSTISRFIRLLPEADYNKFLEKIKDTSYYTIALSSKFISDEDTYKILKMLKKSSYSISISKPVSIDVIKKFAPISRLEVIERLCFSAQNVEDRDNIFGDATSEELNDLLFSASIRYTKRVQQAMDKLNKLTNSKEDNNV